MRVTRRTYCHHVLLLDLSGAKDLMKSLFEFSNSRNSAMPSFSVMLSTFFNERVNSTVESDLGAFGALALLNSFFIVFCTPFATTSA